MSGSLRVWSPEKNRWYTRKFDHDETRARFAAGESIAAIARSYGVSHGAVQRVVDPAFAARLDMRTRERNLAVCEECRGPCLSISHPSKKAHAAKDGRQLCRDCRNKQRRTGVVMHGSTVVEVRCVTCRSWLEPEAFSSGRRYRDLREGGFHQQCSPCQTKARQAYRERHKVPCDRCGKPRLPQSEKKGGARGNRVRDTGLCLACYRDQLRERRAA